MRKMLKCAAVMPYSLYVGAACSSMKLEVYKILTVVLVSGDKGIEFFMLCSISIIVSTIFVGTNV